MFSLVAQCHLVLSVLGTLVTIMASVLHCFLSFVTTLSSASFIPVTSCISSIHLLLGRPLLLLLPSSHSFIHYGDLYSAPSRLLRSAPDPCTAKEKSFEARVKCIIIPFSNPSDCITCPKNPSFLLITVCCSVSSSSIPISIRTLSLVFSSVHEIFASSSISTSHSVHTP